MHKWMFLPGVKILKNLAQKSILVLMKGIGSGKQIGVGFLPVMKSINISISQVITWENLYRQCIIDISPNNLFSLHQYLFTSSTFAKKNTDQYFSIETEKILVSVPDFRSYGSRFASCSFPRFPQSTRKSLELSDLWSLPSLSCYPF